MPGLKPFRHIPKNVVEWERWCNDQDIPDEATDPDLSSYITNATIKTGNGSPEGVVAALIGTLYLNLDGGTDTTLYVKETGNNTDTGWVAK